MQAYEKSEDPIYVLDNNIPIDPQYYLENQISKVCPEHLSSYSKLSFLCPFLDQPCSANFQPLLRIFEPILKNASKELLHGSHTRAVSISTPSNSGIMKFAKKQLTCLGCKAVIR
jgi:DNA polymerase delta subunit 1